MKKDSLFFIFIFRGGGLGGAGLSFFFPLTLFSPTSLRFSPVSLPVSLFHCSSFPHFCNSRYTAAALLDSSSSSSLSQFNVSPAQSNPPTNTSSSHYCTLHGRSMSLWARPLQPSMYFIHPAASSTSTCTTIYGTYNIKPPDAACLSGMSSYFTLVHLRYPRNYLYPTTTTITQLSPDGTTIQKNLKAAHHTDGTESNTDRTPSKTHDAA